MSYDARNRTLVLGRTAHTPLRDMKEQEARNKLLWLIDHPSPEFDYYLDQYVAARNLGLKPIEARQVAEQLTRQTFYNITHNVTYNHP